MRKMIEHVPQKIVEEKKYRKDQIKRKTDDKVYFILELRIPKDDRRLSKVMRLIISYTSSARFEIKARFQAIQL